MAIPISIEKLMNENIVEYARIEFKENWNPEPILHTICAFANDIDNWGGGYIVVGVKEENGMPVHPVTGIPVAALDRIQKDLLALCHKIKPLYIPVCEPVVYEEKHLLLIWAPGGYERPYKAFESLSKDKKKVTAYVRRFSNTVKASDADLKELHSIGNNVPFDDRVNPRAELKDLKIPLITDYLGEVESALYPACYDMSIKELAESLKIADGPTEFFKPLNVGLMFFNDRPDDYFRYARIEVVSISDPTGEGMTERVFKGPIHRQLVDALAYIRNSILAEMVLKSSDRAEANRIHNYPFSAIEEILCNAVYHKSYQIAEPITVRVEEDRMSITSCPGPDRSISTEDIANRRLISRRYRNRRIGDFLKELKLIEGRNTGVPTILRALRENGSPLPIFETDEERSYFTVTLKIHEAFLEKDIPEFTEVKPRKIRRSREQIRNEVLKLLRTKDYSQNELAQQMGYSGVSKTFSIVIEAMINAGLIKYSGCESERSPNLKLQIIKTEHGEVFEEKE